MDKLKSSTDKIDRTIEGKIEKETASYIVNIYSALIRISLMVLGFVVSLLALLVAIIGMPKLHDYMNNVIGRTHKKYEEESDNRIMYRVCMQLSHSFYLYYKNFFTNPDHLAFKSGVSLAVWFAEGAIQTANNLPENELEKSLLRAELHRAYHYASESISLKKISTNQEIAISIAREHYDFADKTYDKKITKWFNYKEIVAWIYILLGNENEIKEGKSIVIKILGSDYITRECLKLILNNYNELRLNNKFKDDSYFEEYIEEQANIYLTE